MKYSPQKIEKKWQKIWLAKKVYEPDFAKAQKPFYNLMMFPYPSAEGLHVGNMYAFTGADIYGRMKRMQGYDVFEPIGLDGFGIHSENYALKVGRHPAVQAKISEKNFYRQLHEIGNGFAWDEKLETYDPAYYRWTQWIFTEMWRRGLAYRKKQPVNWCPSCKTVLADEQVLQKSQKSNPKNQNEGKGVCERCDTPVIKKDLEQWFFKTTDYAERLLNDLENLDWSEKVKVDQRNWIGRSEGALIKFKVKSLKLKVSEEIEVFTTRPDTLFGATYLVVAPEHAFVQSLLQIPNSKSQIPNVNEVKRYVENARKKGEAERAAEGKEKTGIELKGITAINPATKEEIPIWVADYVLASYGTGAIMAVPAHDDRDFEFAKKYELPMKMVVCPHYPAATCPILDHAYIGEGHLVDSGKFDGMSSEEAKWEITTFAGGKRKVQYRLRDWLISRQRYWGPPIPMIYCAVCAKERRGEQAGMSGWYAVPEKDLPVKLPMIEKFRPTGTGKSPLAAVEKFYKVKCGACGNEARRETDVSDTFLDSAWYYIGYLAQIKYQKSPPKADPPRAEKIKNPFTNPFIKRWLPIDMYTGGAEHSVLHLLYVRFLAKVFHDLGLVHFSEPAKKFRAHGLLIREGKKISKSKGNIINPDQFIKEFGADALRMHLMFIGPFEHGGDFYDQGILGPVRFLERVWKMGEEILNIKKQKAKINEVNRRHLHRTIKKVTEDIENLHYNTAISAFMILLNEFEKQRVGKGDFLVFLQLLAPFAPYITEELWAQLGNKKSIHLSAWPTFDPKFVEEETFELIIQVNGKMRDKVLAPSDITQHNAEKIAREREVVKKWLTAPVKKVIFVANRMINFVI